MYKYQDRPITVNYSPKINRNSPFVPILPSKTPLPYSKANDHHTKIIGINSSMATKDYSDIDSSRSYGEDINNHVTPFEKLVYDYRNDPKFQADQEEGRRIGFYRLIRNVGIGSFSLVKLGIHMLAQEKVAIKILDRNKLNHSTHKLLLREIRSIERLHHPNIIRLYEVIETPSEYYIATEYVPDGTLEKRITSEGKMSETDAKYFFAQLTAAVDHMHSKGVVHRDIKAENIFFANDRLIKLGDFGLSTISEKDQLLNTFCGSPQYAAPELFSNEEYLGIYVDIWALGILVYYMVTGLMPFRAENTGKLKKAILHGAYSIPPCVSDECQELIRALLNPEPTDRWYIEEIRSCDWLKQQHFPQALEPFPLNLANFWTSSKRRSSDSDSYELLSERKLNSSLEVAAHAKLKELGITPELVRKATLNTRDELLFNPDSVNGTYRIIIHRLQKQSNPLERDVTSENLSSKLEKGRKDRSKSVNVSSAEQERIWNNHRRASHNVQRKRSDANLDQSSVQMTQTCTIL